MSQDHKGNMIPEITREEHDGTLNAKRTTIVSSVTINAVVNTGAGGGNVTLDPGSRTGLVGNVTIDSGLISIIGNITLSDSRGFIGLITSTLGASPAFIGITTVANRDRTITGNVTLDDGSLTGIIGNITISDSKGFIGLTTTVAAASPAFIGIVTIANTNIRAIAGNVTLADSRTFIGLTTTTLGASPAFIGIVTIANTNIRTIAGNLTLSDSKTFIGLVTSISRNAGTTKTLIPKNLSFAQNSIATIAVPANTFYITKILLNSNATVRLNIKSGATYLTGNVSLGININPGGGWVEVGSPDAPVYIGLAATAGIVLEKFDSSGVVSQIGGSLVYFDE